MLERRRKCLTQCRALGVHHIRDEGDIWFASTSKLYSVALSPSQLKRICPATAALKLNDLLRLSILWLQPPDPATVDGQRALDDFCLRILGPPKPGSMGHKLGRLMYTAQIQMSGLERFGVF